MGYPPNESPYYLQPWENPYFVPVRAHTEAATHQAPMSTPRYMVDPYVVQTLQSVMGKVLVVNTGHGTLRGRLNAVKPDHIVLQEPEGKSTFFVRIQKIVWIMPD